MVPPSVCTLLTLPDEAAAQHLLWSGCVADVMQYHVVCAYTQLFKRDLDEVRCILCTATERLQAVAHLATSVLVALLCDGCRVDGLGFPGLALDDLLWRFGLLTYEALQLKAVAWEDAERYAWAASAVASKPPHSAWRGQGHAALLFGRSKCQAVLRPPCPGRVCMPCRAPSWGWHRNSNIHKELTCSAARGSASNRIPWVLAT